MAGHAGFEKQLESAVESHAGLEAFTGRRAKERTYAELCRSNRCRLTVLAPEIGGRAQAATLCPFRGHRAQEWRGGQPDQPLRASPAPCPVAENRRTARPPQAGRTVAGACLEWPCSRPSRARLWGRRARRRSIRVREMSRLSERKRVRKSRESQSCARSGLMTRSRYATARRCR